MKALPKHMFWFLPLPAMLSRWVFTLVISLFVLAAEVQSEPGVFPTQPVLADYLAWAQEHSPRLGQQAAHSEAMRAVAQAAGALPGLRLAWGEMIVPVETRVGPQQRVFSVSQNFPWFGTLAAKESSLASEADAAVETLRGLSWQVEHEVREAWYELAFFASQIKIVARDLELAQRTEIHARARYESGEGPYAAVLKAQMEIGRLDTRLVGLRDRLKPATSRLNIAAGIVTDLPTPVTLDFPPRLLMAELPVQTELVAVLHRNSPVLESLRYQEEGRRHGVAAAGRRSYPDLTLGVDYIMTGDANMPGVEDSGKDPVIARVAVNIPLWGGQAAAEQKASAGLLRATSAGLSDTRLRLEGQLQNVLFAWRDAGRDLELYGEALLPRSAQNLAVVTASYESGQSDFDQLQAARQAHLGLELAQLRASTDRLLALNDLGALLGVAMDDLANGILPLPTPKPKANKQ